MIDWAISIGYAWCRLERENSWKLHCSVYSILFSKSLNRFSCVRNSLSVLLSVCAFCICGCLCVLCVNACLCVCSYVYVYMHIYTRVCVHACLDMHVCVCVYADWKSKQDKKDHKNTTKCLTMWELSKSDHQEVQSFLQAVLLSWRTGFIKFPCRRTAVKTHLLVAFLFHLEENEMK